LAQPIIVRQFRHDVAGFAERQGFAGSALDAIRACVSEAVTNSLVHAYGDSGGTGMITVSAELRDGELILRVSDDGRGFRPRTDRPGLGLGIPLIASLADSMSIDASEAGGTELCMSFKRQGDVAGAMA
jgi:anti-sigma regulatory factor (Ser/Thr protein kinase)